jgi:phenylacetate-CoA ligase
MSNDQFNLTGFSSTIPPDRKERNPLMTAAGWRNFQRIQQSRFAPIWNYEVGDRLLESDLPAVDLFRRQIATHRPSYDGVSGPPDPIVDFLESIIEKSPFYRRRIVKGFDVKRDWNYLPTFGREELFNGIETLVPDDADIERLVVYDTSATTGHPLRIPQHPCAMAKNHPLLDLVLAEHNALPTFHPEMVALFNVGSESHSVMFPNTFSVWNEAGFAKINLHSKGWCDTTLAQKFFDELRPSFLTGDPVAFAEMLRWNITANPTALVSTAVSLNPGLRQELESRYNVPVIDFYSTTETGPVAVSEPRKVVESDLARSAEEFKVLPPDIYVEIVDAEGFPVPPGQSGEITVSGGRNPYLPLIRYRTGDYAAMSFDPDKNGNPVPRIYNLVARKPVVFQGTDGLSVHPIDIGRELRRVSFAQHELIQRVDRSLDIILRPIVGVPINQEQVVVALRTLFGERQEVRVTLDETLGIEQGDRSGGGKPIPYRTQLGQ